MLQSEFTERTGLQVTSECYHEFIEPDYNGSTLNKDEWCKQWKRKGGLQKAYTWQVRHDEEKLSHLRNVRKSNDILSESLSAAISQLDDAKAKLTELHKELDSLKEIERKYNLIKNIVA